MNKIKILITGSNGFVGKSLVELLDKSKYDIIAKNHQELDLLDEQEVDKFFDTQKVDYVIHTATIGGGKRPDMPGVFYTNVKMFENLIKHKDKYKLMITFGSGAELVDQFPLNFYALSKKYIITKINRENLNCVNLRLYGCFGKHEEDTRFIKSNLMRYRNKESMVIHANRVMSFFYVNDIIPVIEYYLTMNTIPIVKSIDMCYPYSPSLINIACFINTLDTHKVKIKLEKIDINEPYTGYSPLFLGNFKFIGLEEGIKQMWNEISR